MYDLAEDPMEANNLAYSGCHRTPAQQHAFERLQAELAAVEQKRLQPLHRQTVA
jgi:hypothetical protein